MYGTTDKVKPAPTGGKVTVRLAAHADAPGLIRLAALDSAPLPAGVLLVAELDHELVAAVPVDGGAAIADPFRRTAALVQMLDLRARQMRAAAHPGTGRRLARGRPAPALDGAALRHPAP